MSADPVPSQHPEVTRLDLVRSPPHYKRAGALETIDLIDMTVDGYSDPRLAYYIGNCLKYLSRAPHKGNMQQDLEKSSWYLTRAINRTAELGRLGKKGD
jgi:hypothetical protein